MLARECGPPVLGVGSDGGRGVRRGDPARTGQLRAVVLVVAAHHLVQHRLRGPGMRWSEPGAAASLALRSALPSTDVFSPHAATKVG